MPKTKSARPWTLAEGVDIIRQIEPDIRELGYHTMLGGSLLHKGTSEKDLDIFFSPLNGYETRSFDVLQYLQTVFGRCSSIQDQPDYKAGEPWYWREMHYFMFEGRRIDVFIQ